jgi:hypothetical protein
LKQYIGLLAILFCFFPSWSIAQTVDFSENDSISVSDVFFQQTDIVRSDSVVNEKLLEKTEKFMPDSKKATIYAVVFPGLGQIYNRKYWKLPLVYGSLIGCAYAINWNTNQYNGYKNAYVDFIDDDPKTDSWYDYRYGSYRRTDFADWTAEMKRSFETSLKSARDYHRRNRDLSYIVAVGVYALWIIDAYVDAQLFDFDISPDLSMRVEPVLFNRTPSNAHSVGMQLSLAF